MCAAVQNIFVCCLFVVWLLSFMCLFLCLIELMTFQTCNGGSDIKFFLNQGLNHFT